MTTKSKRNLPIDDEPEYTFGKFKPTTGAPEGSPEEGKDMGVLRRRYARGMEQGCIGYLRR